MASTQSDFYSSYIDKLKQKAKEAIIDAQKKTFSEYFELADKKIRDIYEKTIDDFYQDYSNPHVYSRRGSLYKLIETEKGDDYLDVWFEPSKISYRNGYAGEDGLYTTVFREGWHGGASIGGSMLYPVGKSENGSPRTYDGTYKDGRYKPYEDENYRYSWTVANRSSIPPLIDFKQRIDEYQKSEYQEDYNKLWNKNKANIKIEM